MDTLQFLRLILPRKGLKILAIPRPAPYKGYVHHLFESFDDMAAEAEGFSSEGSTVYHACASFKEHSVTVQRRNRKTGELEDKAAVRVADNAGWCRSFWVDLDVEEGSEQKYPTQRDAATHVLQVCQQNNLPLPLLVSSGYGVHAYWPLTEDISAEAWVKLAQRFKAVLHALGVKQDPTRTADVASVLRPVGTSNYKRETPRLVRVLRLAEPIAPRDFMAPVLAALKHLDVQVADKPKAQSLNSDLITRVEYPPSSAEKIADKCQAIGHFRTVMGDVEEPFWRAALGVIKHTVEGDALAHEWSQGHAGYDRFDTQDKMDRWTAGPSTCATFECFGKCDGCPVKGKVKSPIQLGTTLPEQASTVEMRPPRVSEDAVTHHEPERVDNKIITLPSLPESMQNTYRYTKKGNLVMMVPGDEGEPDIVVPICQEYIVPFAIIRPSGDARQGNRAILKCWRFTLSGMREEITVPLSVVSTGGKDFVGFFGDIGIIVEGVPMQRYMKDWIKNLKVESDDAISAERMGWAGEGFVVGQRLYTPTGPTKASMASNLQNYQNAFTAAGTAREWTRLINEAYNRPGQEQYQFLIACGFGAPLMPFIGDYRGVIVSAVSYQSGQGKTTAQRAAMSIYGDPAKLETAYGRQTTNALFEKLGALGNLPFMIDEVSNIDSEELSALAYAISQGVQKDRLTKSGDLRQQREAWQTLVLTSGNRSLISALSADNRQSEPEMRRIFEFTFEPVSDLSKSQADRVFNELRGHYGVAGEVYLDYLVRNQETVKAAVAKMTEQMNEKLGLAREERFWGAAITAAMTGLFIANRLGLVAFKPADMFTWVQKALNDLRGSVRINAGDEFDLLNSLMADLSFDLWVTATLGDRRSKPAVVVREPRRGQVGGRLILSTNTLLLRPEYIRGWCDKRRADWRLLRSVLIKHGCMVESSPATMDLMTGVAGISPLRSRLWTVDATRLEALVPGSVVVPQNDESNVVQLRPGEVS